MFALARQGYFCVDTEMGHGGIYKPPKALGRFFQPHLYSNYSPTTHQQHHQQQQWPTLDANPSPTRSPRPPSPTLRSPTSSRHPTLSRASLTPPPRSSSPRRRSRPPRRSATLSPVTTATRTSPNRRVNGPLWRHYV